MSDITQILNAIEHGDAKAADELLPLVYHELRRLAAHRMASAAPGQTLQSTALVHEAHLWLVGPGPAQRWDGRGHFFAAAAEALRRILIEKPAAGNVCATAADRNEWTWTKSRSPPRRVTRDDYRFTKPWINSLRKTKYSRA